MRRCVALLGAGALAGVLLAGGLPALAAAPASSPRTYDETLFQALEYRLVGPFRGGRVTAVTGIPGDRSTFYMGSTGGGVWKTTDAGLTWRNVSDEAFASASVGAVEVAPSDPNVVYAGMGSACVRGNTSPGDGVYRSTDAGRTWAHVGLGDAGQIGRIAVDPRDPDRVYVAVLGHAFGPSKQRGVYRSTDGGATWKQVLDMGREAGAVDLAMDPTNPRILFAATYRLERKPWTLISGGPGSGLHRTADGGDTWTELTDGLPDRKKGPWGRIGVSVSGANPDRVYALIEAEEGGLFRSDDGGKKFRRINQDREFRQRAWYYTHVFADPADANTVYILNVGMYRSTDGGKTFQYIRAPHGDHHALWIDPTDNRVLINGNDGGANVSHNGGASWSAQDNQPTAEMYRLTVDDQFPYRLYGCQQDNSCLSIPSRTSGSSIDREDWFVPGGCESGHVAVDPRNPSIIYSGCYGGTISRYDHATGQDREIMAYPQLAVGQAAKDLRYRFQWNAPIRLSPHDPGVLYHASQVVHRSTDEGQSWEVISPDLTRNDKSKQAYAGEPITRDNTGVEVYGTIFALEESPHQRGVLWAGSDDGLVHISRDNGRTWKNVTPRQMPEWGQVNAIELSAHGPGRAFLAVTRYRMDDFAPYILRTDDYGATWQSVTGRGLPSHHFVRAVREDPDRKGLLYAGTEFGIHVSFDDGRNWQPLQLKLPVTPVTDLAVKNQDLVVATQGRSFWILDDLTVLHQMTPQVAAAKVHLFEPRAAYRFGGGGFRGGGGTSGKNPPAGVLIHYLLAEEPAEDTEVRLEILDGAGQVLRTLSSQKDEPRAPSAFARFFPERDTGRRLETKAGLNRYVWNFRLHDADLVDDAVLWGLARGPKVPPGTYQARLTVGGTVQTRSFQVLADPRLDTTQAGFEASHRLARSIWESMSTAHQAIRALRDVRKQVDELVARLEKAGKGEGLADAAKPLKEKLTGVEEALNQARAESSQDILNFPTRLDGQFLGLLGIVESADAPPTQGALLRYEELRAELDRHLADLRAVLDTDLADFNGKVRSRDVPPVLPVGVPGR